MLRAAVPVLFCVLVFFFALHAKTALYGAAAQTKVTPSTSSKMWVSGQKMDAPVLPPSAVPLFCALVSLLGLVLLNQPRLQFASKVPPPSNLRLWHLHRFLRPPPFQS